MKGWICPNCKILIPYNYGIDDKLVMKNCSRCGESMEVFDEVLK